MRTVVTLVGSRRSWLPVPLLLAFTACLPVEWGAGAILHPWRRPLLARPPLPKEDVSFRSGSVELKGWLFRTRGPRRGTIVYLHGVADNRQSSIGVAQRLVPAGYDVLAYDSRAHGQSGGAACTYGFHEKRDLSAALDAIGVDRAILFGASLGGAVALQAAAIDPRIRGVIAQSSFSDLHTIVSERAPWFATRAEVDGAIALAEARGDFRVAAVSPVEAAASIRIPVLLLHGARDLETPARHSRRIHDRLAGPKRLVVLPDAGHNDVLGQEPAWTAILEWLETLPIPPRS